MAAKRSEPSDRTRMQWLLAFLRSDVSGMTKRELLAAFRQASGQLHVMAGRQVAYPVWSASFTAEERRALEGGDLTAPGSADAVRNLLQRLQRQVQDGLDVLRRRMYLARGQSPIPMVWRPFPQEAPGWVMIPAADGTLYRAYSGAWVDVSVASAADLLMRWWPLLRLCPYCQARFLPTHGKQQYCKPECSQRTRYEKWAPKRDHKQEMIRRNERDEEERERARTRKRKGAR